MCSHCHIAESKVTTEFYYIQLDLGGHHIYPPLILRQILTSLKTFMHVFGRMLQDKFLIAVDALIAELSSLTMVPYFVS